MSSLLPTLMQKIRFICKQCNGVQVPSKYHSKQPTVQIFQQYIETLEKIRMFIINLKQLEQQHMKLQTVLQKQETQIRKHIGVEQQLKLYIQNVKGQLQQSQIQRIQLLENSKNIIKTLKSQNQKLYYQNQIFQKQNSYFQHQAKQNKQNAEKPKKNRGHHQSLKQEQKSKNKSGSRSKKKKTELTQRDRNHHISTSQKKKTNQSSKKKDVLPNYTILSYMNSKKKKEKNPFSIVKQFQQKTKKKSQTKKSRISVFKFYQNSHQKMKRRLNANSSVNSIGQMDQINSKRI